MNIYKTAESPTPLPDEPPALPRLSELPGCIPFRRGEILSDESRARLLEALNWTPFLRDLEQLAARAEDEAQS